MMLFFGSSAHALVEARLSYGLMNSAQGLSSIYTTSSTVPAINPNYGLGADLLVKIPLVPVGFGVRYEKMGLSASSGGLEYATDMTRTSLVLNYRLIDTLLYVGPIFTYGLSHSGNITVKNGGSKVVDYSSSSMSSYSIGLEAGVNLLTFIIGAEVGTETFPWKGATDSVGTMGAQDLQMGGSYAKIMFGFGI